MTTEQILSLNKVEKAEYMKPKYWAKEGIRDITCYFTYDEKVYISATLTDYKCLWFSVCPAFAEETIAGIMQVLIDTTKEKNETWYCSEEHKIRNAIHLPFTTLQNAFPIKVRITTDSFTDPEGNVFSLSALGSSEITENILSFARRKYREADSANHLSTLTSLFNRIVSVSMSDKPSVLQSQYLQLKPTILQIRELEFMKLSGDSKARDLCIAAISMCDHWYNSNMSVSR